MGKGFSGISQTGREGDTWTDLSNPAWEGSSYWHFTESCWPFILPQQGGDWLLCYVKEVRWHVEILLSPSTDGSVPTVTLVSVSLPLLHNNTVAGAFIGAQMAPVDDGHCRQPACVNVEAQCCMFVLCQAQLCRSEVLRLPFCTALLSLSGAFPGTGLIQH